jgi:regulator of replication initiation timing
MLTPEDIQKLTEYQKTVFVTEESFSKAMAELRDSFSTLQTSVDAIVKENVTGDTEEATLGYKMEKIETWIDQAAPKLDIKFEH